MRIWVVVRKGMLCENRSTKSKAKKEGNPMVTITVHCPHCGSEDLKRNGHAKNGKQKYYCHGCKKQSRENPTPNVYSEERRDNKIVSREKQLRWTNKDIWSCKEYGDRLAKKRQKGHPNYMKRL